MNRVTVITVCYNAENEIEKTMRSVCEQDYSDTEYLVIDGASKDGTVRIAERIREEFSEKSGLSIRVYSEKDCGIYDAMNKGIRYATGEWTLFMNAGDTFHSADVISSVFAYKDYSGVAGVYGDTVRVRGEQKLFVEGRSLEEIRTGLPLPFCHQSVFVRSSALRDMPFDIRYKQAGDYHFFARMCLKNACFVHVPVTVADYQMGGVSETNTVFHLKEKISIREELQLERFPSIRKWYLINKLRMKQQIKKILPKKVIMHLINKR